MNIQDEYLQEEQKQKKCSHIMTVQQSAESAEIKKQSLNLTGDIKEVLDYLTTGKK